MICDAERFPAGEDGRPPGAQQVQAYPGHDGGQPAAHILDAFEPLPSELMNVPMALPEWTVLVLLSQRPAHGFAVSQLTSSDGELGRIWRIPRPVVYRAIGRLVDAGLIAPESVEPGLGPQRTIYRVTARGREEAERWLGTPVAHVRDIRSHLLIKLALLHRAGRDPADLLRRQRAALDPIARAIQAPRAEPDGFDEILLAWRRAAAAAALGFLDEIAAKTEAGQS